MRGVNKVIICGNVGSDPAVRTFPNGGKVVSISIATNEVWTDKQTGERKENTEWHDIEMFGKLADIAENYVIKGAIVYVEGAIKTQRWKDQQGNDRERKVIKGDVLTLVSGGKQANQNTNQNSYQQYGNNQQRPQQPQYQQQGYQQPQQPQGNMPYQQYGQGQQQPQYPNQPNGRY